MLLLAAAAAVILLPSHASVVGSTPGSGDLVVDQPGTFSVVMNEEILAIEGAAGTNVMQLTDEDGLFYGDSCIAVEGDTIALDAQLGAAGDYTLTYQLVSADGHAVDGTVAFAFEPVAGTESATGSATAPVCGESVASSPAAEDTDSAASSAPEAAASAEPGAADEPAAGGNLPLLLVGGVAALAAAGGIAIALKRRSSRGADGEETS
ncbi:copper resistance protein CopC [Agrococcus sp. Ld7]|uniref:copper resistance CopC family protein n=1 Tax=Agrococcus sp. Ld7 TaxID=649148 RepID=UPI0038677A2E